jgi:hypothetical protein
VANNPFVLAARFLLELAALFAFGYWGWTQHAGLTRLLWAVGTPLAAAAAWGTFRVPGQHGKGLVAVPGPVRLLLEFVFFAAAAWALYAADRPNWALVFGVLVVLHYIASYDYVRTLLR